MPIDWESFQDRLDSEIDAAATETSERLASKVSSLTRLTDAEVKELFPHPADVQHLKHLMEIVHSAENANVKRARLISNVDSLAGAALTLLGKFA